MVNYANLKFCGIFFRFLEDTVLTTKYETLRDKRSNYKFLKFMIFDDIR